MLIKIDVREIELLNHIKLQISNNEKFKNINIKEEQLPLGDIIINDGINDLLIIERKTINDLSASINDGRYEEQSYRLNGLNHPNHNIIYLIEGNINPKLKNNLTLHSAMFSIIYYKGFSLMRSFNINETAIILCNMVNKIEKSNKSPFYKYKINNELIKETFNGMSNETLNDIKDDIDYLHLEQNQTNKELEYCHVIKKVKKENITKANIGPIMLSQIPGISSQTAIAIFNKFKTISNLIKSIEQDEKSLNDIFTIDSKNKSRKISKKCIENIILFLKNDV